MRKLKPGKVKWFAQHLIAGVFPYQAHAYFCLRTLRELYNQFISIWVCQGCSRLVPSSHNDTNTTQARNLASQMTSPRANPKSSGLAVIHFFSSPQPPHESKPPHFLLDSSSTSKQNPCICSCASPISFPHSHVLTDYVIPLPLPRTGFPQAQAGQISARVRACSVNSHTPGSLHVLGGR